MGPQTEEFQMRKILYLICLFYVAILTGCATQIEPPIDPSTYQKKPWVNRRIAVNQKINWKVQGAVSIQSNGKAQMGSFTWEQIGARYAINIYGPLNLGAIGIQGVPGRVTLFKPTGSYTAVTAEALMQQQLGWYLPVSNMYFWIRGLPAPGPAQKSQDKFGHLVLLQQQGWTIQFQSFQNVDNADLPRKIIMDNQRLRVKLVINSWDLGHD